MYYIMDMGTSNTRMWLCDGTHVLCEKKGAFGAKYGKLNGRDALYKELKALFAEIKAICPADDAPECIMVSGMAGSEMGLCEIPHITLPADGFKLADNLAVKSIPEITDIPFVFVPGLKQMQGERLLDIMRGEETEMLGILSMLPKKDDLVLVLPGTHNKIICVNKSGEITEFYTTMSGELIDMVISHSILSGQVSHNFEMSELFVRQGKDYADQNGINAALFHIRIMAKNGVGTDELSSFLYGAIAAQDVDLIRRVSGGKAVYVGGNKNLRKVYSALLYGSSALSEEVSGNAVKIGLSYIYQLYKARLNRNHVLEAIKSEKLIAIIRAPEKETFPDAVNAIYEGGVRLAEITFDRSGKTPKEDTASTIGFLAREYKGKMLVGAGTVTTAQEVMLAFKAGASFIISPNCDEEIISLTKKLGLVSIPAAFTPTEIAYAIKCGADYVKLFPADQAGKGYVKAVKAPLSDANLLAVGGVALDNIKDFMAAGFCGVGIGTSLYNKDLIRTKDFLSLKALAAKYVNAVK